MISSHSSADLGGRLLGAVTGIGDDSLFHHAWEARVLAMAVAMGPTGQWTLDHTRSARETLPPERYLSNTYYQTWFEALCVLLLERGLVSAAELQIGRCLIPGQSSVKALGAERVDQVLATGSPTLRESSQEARFVVGQRVRVRSNWTAGHTRAPSYIHGKRGTVIATHGAHILPDRRSQRLLAPFDETPEWLYSVEFAATELWGPSAEVNFSVSVDAFETYLEAHSEHV